MQSHPEEEEAEPAQSSHSTSSEWQAPFAHSKTPNNAEPYAQSPNPKPSMSLPPLGFHAVSTVSSRIPMALNALYPIP